MLSLLLGALALTGAASAQDRTTESGEAAITDPSTECTAYAYAPVTAAKANFPEIWTPVTAIYPNDTAAYAKFTAMNASIPDISPKGTMAGDFSNFTPTYPATDPDCWWTYHQCTTPSAASGLSPDVASVPEPRTLGYGFDDGPNCSHNAFYDYLTENEQKATMFYIGSNVMDWPLEAQRAVADGHQICVHTWSHRYMTSFSNEGAFGELYYTMQAIKLVTGVTPTCWRPPFGDVDNRIRYIASQLGLETILWKYDSNDWKVGTDGITAQDVQQNYDNLIANVSGGLFDTQGAIMLTHELNNYTMQVAMDNYPALARAFDHIVPIAVAQNKTTPYVETNYTFQNFASYIANHTNATVVSDGSVSASAGASAVSGGSGSQSTGAIGKSAGVALRVPASLALGLVVLGAALCL
ncbi:carbohydrate esterase family 4 protein [Mycena maculata]|uniref:chitin deacetylase n=1 Tax=Mycena maculata TaxID=230809 RepID=A0AAD7MW03_9AGAR|nr:carbohydrate esterase family 4 protein [Mycena maculata]